MSNSLQVSDTEELKTQNLNIIDSVTSPMPLSRIKCFFKRELENDLMWLHGNNEANAAHIWC